MNPPFDTGLQDGMLQYFLSVSAQSDANVEARLEREPFDVTTLMYTPIKAKNEIPRNHDLALQSYGTRLQRRTP